MQQQQQQRPVEGPSLTLPQRVTAATGASIISALVVNPLDVVKVRMQAEAAEGGVNLAQLRSYQAYCFHRSIPIRSLQDASRVVSSSQVTAALAAARPTFVAHRSQAPSKPAGRTGLLTGASLSWPLSKPWSARISSHCLCAATANGAGVLSFQELDALPVCDKPVRQRAPGMLSTFQNIVRQEGLKTLWRGLDSALLMSVPTVLLYYPLYDSLQSVLAAKARDSPVQTLAAPMVAGAVARTITVYAVSPLELVRVRQQAGTAAGTSMQTAGASGGMSTMQALRSSLGEGATLGGVSSLSAVSRLWTGLSATIARDVPFSAIYWGLVEPIRGTLLRSFNQDSHSVQSASTVDTATIGVSDVVDTREGLEDITAWAPSEHTHSHDSATHLTSQHAAAAPRLARAAPTHAQLILANLVAGSLAGVVASAATTPFDVVKTRMQLSTVGAPRQERMWSVLQQVVRQQGVQGLFVGVGPRAARCAPACAIVIACYEVLKKFLAEPTPA